MVEVIDAQAGAAEDGAGVGGGGGQDGVPLLDQGRGVDAAHPVHVIEQDEAGQAGWGLLQELRDGAGVDLQVG